MPTNIYQRSAMALAIAACFPAAGHAAGVARVDFAVGNVTAVGADGRSRALTRGSEIEVGDTVNTQQGRAQLRFQDGAFMSLQPETSFKVEQFRFAENGGGNDNIVMNLLKGGMRTITGLIGRANRQNYRMRTDVATIGIRGTEYAVRYTNSVEIFCAGGVISVENEGGQLVLGSGQGGMVFDPKQEPQRTNERPFLPPTPSREEPQVTADVAPPVNPVQESQTALLTGKFTGNWAISNADNFVVRAETEMPVDMGTGALLAFDSFEGGTTQIGTGTPVNERNSDGIIAWGRWVGGQSTGQYGMDLAAEGAMHYIVGVPVTNMPTTGSYQYTMIGASAPTVIGAGSASVVDSKLVVDFGSSFGSFDIKMLVDGQTLTNSGSLSRSGSHLSATASSVGFLNAQGFLAGNGASRAGMAYVWDFGEIERVSGVIAYQRGATPLAPRAQ